MWPSRAANTHVETCGQFRSRPVVPRYVPLCLAAMLASGCAATDLASNGYDRRDGDTAYRVEETRGGFRLLVRQDLYLFIPDHAGSEASCRREAVALATEEARRRGWRSEVDAARVRSTYGRNGLTGVSSCSAAAVVEEP